jgi:hypothetical protein
MILKNKLGITNSAELARIEEKISKAKGYNTYKTENLEKGR